MRNTPEKEQIVSILIIVISVLIFGSIAVYFFFFSEKTPAEDDRYEYMPNVVGYSFDDVAGCYSRFFSLNVISEDYSDDFEPGIIMSQDMPEKSSYLVGSTVLNVSVSLGKKPFEDLPKVVELDELEAIEQAEVQKKVTGIEIDNPLAEFETNFTSQNLEAVYYGIDTQNENAMSIIDELNVLLQKRGGDGGFLYYDINSGASVEFNADEKFASGDIIKTPYVRAVLSYDIDLGHQYEMSKNMVVSKSYINGAAVGTMFTVNDLVKSTLIDCNATAFNMLYKNIGYDNFNTISAELDIPHRMDDSNYWFRLTARQTASYFKDAYNFTLQHENGDLLHKCMVNNAYDLFASQLEYKDICESAGYQVQEDFYTLGCATIVYSDSPYIIVGYVRGNGTVLNTKYFHDAVELADKLHNELH